MLKVANGAGAILIGFLALPGCTTLSSLGFATRTDSIVLTDASNRAITAVAVDVDDQGRRVKPKRIVCAEPSPDIAKAVSSAIEASLGGKAERTGIGTASLDLALNRSVTESIAQLGSRLATIQLLRDELSDLCRAYANGAVSSITYTLRLSRLDKKMITLLVSEASSGALSRALIGADGSASSGRNAPPELLKAADLRVQHVASEVSDASKKVAEAQELVAKANDADKESARTELGKREALLKQRMVELGDKMAERVALETRGTAVQSRPVALNVGPGTASSLSPVDLRAIHKAYLEDDDVGTLLDACLTSMEDNAVNIQAGDPAVQKLREQTNAKEKELAEVESKMDAFARKARPNSSPSEAELAQFNELIQKQRLLRLDLNQLERGAQELSGVTDRTALLRFCKQGMDHITAIMERKMVIKAEGEMHSQRMELCKVALADSQLSPADKAACLRSVINVETNRAFLASPR